MQTVSIYMQTVSIYIQLLSINTSKNIKDISLYNRDIVPSAIWACW